MRRSLTIPFVCGLQQIPPLQDELDQMHNVSKVLMWRNREPVELDVLCQVDRSRMSCFCFIVD